MNFKDNAGTWITCSIFWLIGLCLMYIGLRYIGPGVFTLGLIAIVGGICILRPFRQN